MLMFPQDSEFKHILPMHTLRDNMISQSLIAVIPDADNELEGNIFCVAAEIAEDPQKVGLFISLFLSLNCFRLLCPPINWGIRTACICKVNLFLRQ